MTDANLVLGRLDPAFFLGGRMTLDLAAARQAVDGRVAAPLGLGVEQAASGILTMTNANLAAAIRLSLFEKGLDPRDFALLSFGGAGSLHALHVAEELGIRRVVFPVDASTLSAWGILHSDLGHDFARSRVLPASTESLPEIAAMAASLRADGADRLEQDGIPSERRALRFSADLRYRGQAFELTVPWPIDAVDAAALERLVSDFHAAHRQRFSYANPHDAVELVTLRLAAIGRLERPGEQVESRSGAAVPSSRRKIWIDGGWHDVPILKRESIGRDSVHRGPLMVEEAYTTALITPGWTLRGTAPGHLLAVRD